VLFSRKDVAQLINNDFEPVWEMVRPVPIVRVDFGNGTVVTRTLHGNIATYACSADGDVLDVLPGIYTPPQYIQSLRQMSFLLKYVNQSSPRSRDVTLAAYHRLQAENLQKNLPAARIVDLNAMSKARIEARLKLAIMPGDAEARKENEAARAIDPSSLSSGDLANWKLLAEDTRINESIRRRQIHEHLAADSSVKPPELAKWLYKFVLHADLDDPYLGLGGVLFASYPFAKEDKR
jgi:hypothetical protein